MGSGNSKQSVENGGVGLAPTMAAAATAASAVTVDAKSTDEGKKDNVSPNKTSSSSSGCPMHQADGSYSYDWRSMFRAAAVHGPNGSKPLSKLEGEEFIIAKAQQQQPLSPPKFPETVGGGCPVRHAPDSKKKLSSSASSQHPEYNVYAQPLESSSSSGIDTTNQMPTGIKNQLPSVTQQQALSTHRVSSTIPKGGGSDNGEEEKTWTYPSPQQFYNALVRKGKMKQPRADLDDGEEEATEHDMESVVALHNNMNEKTWKKIVEWERHINANNDSGDTTSTTSAPPLPKLLKFEGRPHDLSPKGYIKHYLLGHPLPYDRHDWIILRNDGTTVRYVMDYYYDESKAQESSDSAVPALHDSDATSSLLVDVRPALDTPSLLYHRIVTMPYKVLTQQSNFTYLPLRATGELANQVAESIQVWQSIQKLKEQDQRTKEQNEKHASSSPSPPPPPSIVLTQAQAQQVAENFARILKNCQAAQRRIQHCVSDQDCNQASIDLTLCMGAILCPLQHTAFTKALTAAVKKEDEDQQALVIEATLETLSDCVVHCTAERQMAKEQFPNLFLSSSSSSSKR
jgi:cytochrome c heme-lyase